jgi:Raf kinase inhibitor-like YbhB/YbcL family protein
MPFTLSSPDIAPDSMITLPFVYDGCGGDNLSPALQWRGAPPFTQGYALTVYDPDAPSGSGWWHWQLLDLPASTSKLPRDAGAASGRNLPIGARQGPNDYSQQGYGGPCPPPGDPPHRYVFTLFALKVPRLELPPVASCALVGFNLNALALARTSFTARYGR